MNPVPDFDGLVQALEALVTHHFVYFRVQTGRLIATQLFGGDVATMHEQLHRRDGVLAAFIAQKGERLDDLGLTERTLRESLHCWSVVQSLDGPVAERLRYSHLVELIRAPDDGTRKLLAQATLDNAWSRRQLRDAVDEVIAGEWPDTQPDKPGLQPGPPRPPEARVLAPGRVVTRLEKTVEEIDEMTGHLEGVDPADLAPGQRKRARAALRKLRERIDLLDRRFQ